MIIKKRKFIVILVLIALTIGAIFVHSALSPEVSEKESDAVGGIVEEVIEIIAPGNQSFKDFVTKNIRKIAHFVEFGALGLETVLFFFLYYIEKRREEAALSTEEEPAPKFINSHDILRFTSYFLVFGILVAFFDESLQILSKRGPSLTDMWIDIFGYITFAVAFLLIAVCVKVIRYNVKKRKKLGEKTEN